MTALAALAAHAVDVLVVLPRSTLAMPRGRWRSLPRHLSTTTPVGYLLHVNSWLHSIYHQLGYCVCHQLATLCLLPVG